MPNNYFNIAPVRLDMPRSKFPVKFNHKTSFNLGELVPVLCQEVLPGDTFSYDLKSLIRLSTLKAPIMDNLWIDAYAFFVPTRLLWEHQAEFCGENKANAGPQTYEYLMPSIKSHELLADVTRSSVGNYLGLPLITKPTAPAQGVTPFTVLPARGYVEIWNEWFRDENLENPVIISKGDTYLVTTAGTYDYSSGLLKANKMHDYFTSLLPWPLKAAANVSIPLGTTAPLVQGSMYTIKNSSGYQGQIYFGTGGTYTAGTDHYLQATTDSGGTANLLKVNDVNGPSGSSSVVKSINLYADLSNATAASINALRYAFQVQKLLERDAVGGTRYWEMLHAHYGTTSPDASLQRPEYLGGRKFKVNIQQVIQTSADSGSDVLGDTGALSVTGDSSNLFTKSFTEFGYVYVLVVCRQEHTYSQGIPAMFLRQRRFDHYYPEFANLGYQEVKKKEIYFGDSSADENTFGYKEPWAEYRFLPARVSGMLNPNASSALDFWTLSDELPSNVVLSETFMQETPDNLDRVLTVTSSTSDQIIADFDIVGSMVRELPVYSVPGLIDHH